MKFTNNNKALSKLTSFNLPGEIEREFGEDMESEGRNEVKRPVTAARKMEFTKEFKHSGLGYSKRRGVLIVDNNAVSITNIQATSLKEQTKQWKSRTLTRPTFTMDSESLRPSSSSFAFKTC